MIPTWLLVVFGLMVLAYLWGTWTHKHFDKRNVPYGKPTAFLGSLTPFVLKKRSFADMMVDMYNAHKGSGLIGYFRARKPTILMCNPDLIKQITIKDFDYFTDHFAPLGEEDDPLFGKMLFAMKGDRWRHMRHTLSPAYTSSKMKNMFGLVADCGKQLGDYLEKECREHGGIVTTDMKDLYTRFANDVIATSAFGIQCDSLKQPLNEFYVLGKRSVDFSGIQTLKIAGFRLFASLMRFLNIKLMPKNINDFFQNLVHDTISKRDKENIYRPDMIQLLMEARKGSLTYDKTDEPAGDIVKPNDKKFDMTDEDITAQVFVFFLAGFETVSTNLCFISHLLATHPDKLKLIQEEIDSVLQESGGKLSYESLQKMKYTDMVINETLRLWPTAVTVDRVCVKAYTIPATDNSPSYRMEVGDSITIPTFAIHRDPEHFEDPLDFKPERFSDENKHNIKPFTFLPFGAGPRLCIGMRFAVMETKVALSSILSRFDFQVVAKTPVPLTLEKKTPFLGAEGGFWLGIAPRTKA